MFLILFFKVLTFYRVIYIFFLFQPQAQGRGLLDWIGLGEDQDPYIQKSTQQCINGDLADCFKAQALRSFDDFFDKQAYQ